MQWLIFLTVNSFFCEFEFEFLVIFRLFVFLSFSLFFSFSFFGLYFSRIVLYDQSLRIFAAKKKMCCKHKKLTKTKKKCLCCWMRKTRIKAEKMRWYKFTRNTQKGIQITKKWNENIMRKKNCSIPLCWEKSVWINSSLKIRVRWCPK